MRRAFLDTGYLIALEAADDQYHDVCVDHWQKIARQLTSLVTTTYVFDEVVTYFNNRGHHEKAVEIGERLKASNLVEIVFVTEELFEKGWIRFQKRPDKSYSLTDCISFVVMEEDGLKTTLAFDHHFRQEGLQTAPSEAEG